ITGPQRDGDLARFGRWARIHKQLSECSAIRTRAARSNIVRTAGNHRDAASGRLYLFVLPVGANRATSLAPSKVHRCVRPALLTHALIVVHLDSSWKVYYSPSYVRK